MYEGPTVADVSVVASSGAIVINMEEGSTGTGMHWNGTRQCSICCGTLAYPIRVLVSSGTWKYVNPADVSFRNRSMTITGRWAPTWGPFEPLRVRYAWEDSPQCMIYNSNGLPAPPFNVTISAT